MWAAPRLGFACTVHNIPLSVPSYLEKQTAFSLTQISRKKNKTQTQAVIQLNHKRLNLLHRDFLINTINSIAVPQAPHTSSTPVDLEQLLSQWHQNALSIACCAAPG